MLTVRNSDQLRVLVFADGMRALRAVQDFSDFSTSISSTTADLGRDRSGVLTVTETYGEAGGPDRVTAYRWDGRRFTAVKKG